MNACPSSRSLRLFACTAITIFLAGMAAGQKINLSGLPEVITHDNTRPAGVLKDGVLTIHLTFKEGAWHPAAADGPGLPILAFAEQGGPPSIPGPLIRVPEGTRIHASVSNPLLYPMVLHGFDQRPGNAKDVITVNPGETKEADFLAGAPGTYFYWATSLMDMPLDARPTADTEMTGAFIVDAPGAPTDDKVMVIGVWYNWMVPLDFDRGFHEILTINGRSFPHTEHLTYEMGDNIRWRVINASVAEHPMHLHGAFFRVDSDGNGEKDDIYKPAQQRMVVTELMVPGRTMAVNWTPSHDGEWIFHCHLVAHMDPKLNRELAEISGVAGEHEGHMAGMSSMAGLVVPITITPRPGEVRAAMQAAAHKLTMVLSQPPAADGKFQPIRVEIRDGDQTTATAPGADVGPLLVLHRGEPTEITVVNHLSEPTTIHWHGIELPSRYDGVMQYSGDPGQLTRPIEPGASFVVRMTPPRAGSFMYHTHWHDVRQLKGGLYGPLLVLEPGQAYDPEHDRVFIIGRGLGKTADNSPLLVNGLAQPGSQEMRVGEKYRLRFLNMTPNDSVDLILRGGKDAVHWQPVAKDGARLQADLTKACAAKQEISVGETYDFDVTPAAAGELELIAAVPEFQPAVHIHVVDAPTMTRK
jgi:FtsP/CotA-like multicopper oxidase with cupredoxin domain